MTRPAKGDRFLHARQIDGSPKTGTARPVEMVVTAVRRSTVYYTRADAYDKGDRKPAWYVDINRFPSIVREPQPLTPEQASKVAVATLAKFGLMSS
jgi:hypothetical protein